MIVVATAHCASWFLTQTFVQSLRMYQPKVPGYDTIRIVIVDNSWDFSPSIRGITETSLAENVKVVNNHLKVINNPLAVRSHGGALDYVFNQLWPEYLVTMETDVTVMRDGWLGAFWEMMRPTDFVVGGWHDHEQYVSMSCALYRGEALAKVVRWSRENQSRDLRWGMEFEKSSPMTDEEWAGRTAPFGERRGWPQGTHLKVPSKQQNVGPGWYEPGHLLFHWAVNDGYTYTVMPSSTARGGHDGTIPIGTFYGDRQSPLAVHWWAGSRALTTTFVPDGNQDWTDPCLIHNREMWLRREARQWLEIVPKSVQEKTLNLIRTHGWHLGAATEANKRAIAEAERIYREAGIPL